MLLTNANRWWVGCAAGLLAVGATTATATAQDEWVRQAPFPTGRALNAAAFITPDHGFIVGVNHHLLETKDGGRTWIVRDADLYGSDPYYDVHFADALHGYVVGNNQDGLRTTDGGKTWLPMPGLEAGSWSQLEFLDGQTGFAGANGAAAFTSDGGQHWEFRSVYPDCPVMYGMDFKSETTGLVGGYQFTSRIRGVFLTTDGARTWRPVLEVTTNDVIFLDNRTALAAAVEELRIYRSDDGGESWAPWSGQFEADGPLGDLEHVNGDVVVGISLDGDIWRSTDGGRRWDKTFEGLSDLPYKWSVRFLDRDHGWACGPHGILVGTSDGGQSWSVLNNGVGMDVTDLDMFSSEFGIAVHQNGYVSRTTDGGQFWQVGKLEETGQIFGRDESLNAVDIVDADFAAAAGPGGVVFITRDGGESWDSVGYPELPGTYVINGVDFVSRDEGWLVGTGPADGVYYTSDGGWSWQEQYVGRGSWIDVQFLDRDWGWIQSAGGNYRWTDDGGRSWQEGEMPDGPHGSPTVEDIDFANPADGWVAAWWGYVARTTDGGRSWEMLDFGFDVRVALSVHAVSADEAWMGASDERSDAMILHTTDGGRTWSKQYVGDEVAAHSVMTASPSGGLWAAGFRGDVFHLAGTDTCGSIDKFKAKCKRGKLTTIVKSSLAQGTILTIDHEGDRRSVSVDRKGKAKARFTGQPGTHTVFVVECPEHVRQTDCD